MKLILIIAALAATAGIALASPEKNENPPEPTPTPVATPVPTAQPVVPVPTQPPAQQRSVAPVKPVGIAILERIKQCESGGNYQAQNRSSTASGAYQFLDSTWNGYGGYQKARLAPPAVQDQKARETYNRSGTRPWESSRSCWG